MLDVLRLGVREMVEFTLHGEDICFSGGVRVMQEGTAAHKARQALLTGEGWQKEVPLEREIPVDEGDFTFLLSGRMDAFLDGDCPVVEEIKLWSSQDDPEEPQQAHTAQALVYAWMLFQERETLCKIETRVAYVSVDGTLRGMFTRQLSPGECRADFDALFIPFKEQTLFLRRRLQERNRELDALTFPFPAYRAGQREYAVQVYTAIERRKRLFASMPTGTGKSVAGLFPALKALGRGLTGQIFYLTARSTQRQGALDALRLMRPSLPHLHVLTLDARDRVCPESHICHPDFCPRAKGHFLRDLEAVRELLQTPDWTDACIREAAARHCLCRFELSLTLSPMADVVICDYNYALDPAVHLQRIFDRTDQVTLLLDEAHHLLPRIRDMLSIPLVVTLLSVAIFLLRIPVPRFLRGLALRPKLRPPALLRLLRHVKPPVQLIIVLFLPTHMKGKAIIFLKKCLRLLHRHPTLVHMHAHPPIYFMCDLTPHENYLLLFVRCSQYCLGIFNHLRFFFSKTLLIDLLCLGSNIFTVFFQLVVGFRHIIHAAQNSCSAVCVNLLCIIAGQNFNTCCSQQKSICNKSCSKPTHSSFLLICTEL